MAGFAGWWRSGATEIVVQAANRKFIGLAPGRQCLAVTGSCDTSRDRKARVFGFSGAGQDDSRGPLGGRVQFGDERIESLQADRGFARHAEDGMLGDHRLDVCLAGAARIGHSIDRSPRLDAHTVVGTGSGARSRRGCGVTPATGNRDSSRARNADTSTMVKRNRRRVSPWRRGIDDGAGWVGDDGSSTAEVLPSLRSTFLHRGRAGFNSLAIKAFVVVSLGGVEPSDERRRFALLLGVAQQE
ncbi:hypothetical protein Enr13x_32390 [Stieleria neptunia]|uniref:Uncharacterized protein n=1 Tax=Stieleria neptunia TaxID=2527979 RepID=A0A518HRA3_9BACT|nr:hypothetical protein Enr13x_32390 [Stieleria neptunia]